MKRFRTGFAAAAFGVLTVAGGASTALAQDDGYPPGTGVPPASTPGTETPATDPGGTLPETGSSPTGFLQAGGLMLLVGGGMLGAAKLRRRPTTA